MIQGQGKFEELMVCSHEIAASTAQLVAASKVSPALLCPACPVLPFSATSHPNLPRPTPAPVPEPKDYKSYRTEFNQFLRKSESQQNLHLSLGQS